MKTIKDYIQFAIDNGYTMELKWSIQKNIDLYNTHNEFTYYGLLLKIHHLVPVFKSIEEIITSKPFIEAIARGYDKNRLKPAVLTTFHQDQETLYLIIGSITCDQAIAIKDNKLEEFITNLLKK